MKGEFSGPCDRPPEILDTVCYTATRNRKGHRSPDQHDRFQAWTVSSCSPHCGHPPRMASSSSDRLSAGPTTGAAPDVARASWRAACTRPTNYRGRRPSASSRFCAPFEGGCGGSINGSKRRLSQERVANQARKSTSWTPDARSAVEPNNDEKTESSRTLKGPAGEKRGLPPISASPIHFKISASSKGNWLAVPFFRVLGLPPRAATPAPQLSPRSKNRRNPYIFCRILQFVLTESRPWTMQHTETK